MKRRDLLKKGLLTTAGFCLWNRSDASVYKTNGSAEAFSEAFINPVISAEEEVYRYLPADNGAGPLWCKGSTCIVRTGDRVLASGLETVPQWAPMNNCRWMLFGRSAEGWVQKYTDHEGRTREPSPMAAFHDGSVFLSANPSLAGPNDRSGPTRPEICHFNPSSDFSSYEKILPGWSGNPGFTEHSYRSFAADGHREELILFQNIGYTHAEWIFRDSDGKWTAQGQLKWPWGAEYEKPEPIRVCYPAVALKDRKVFFLGVSDIIEPNRVWREYKKQITGRDWDYDFRRLFFTWSDDITTGVFHPWIEIATHEKTCGWIDPLDLWVAPDGDVHMLWNERAIDERLREKFFPSAKQSYALNYAVFRKGKVRIRRALILAGEDQKTGIPGVARFHITPEKNLYAVCSLRDNSDREKPSFKNQLMEILPKGKMGRTIELPFKKPFTNFFTATVRAGSAESDIIDLYGNVADSRFTMNYGQIRLG